MLGPLAQSAERRADNAKVVSSRLTRTIFFFFCTILVSSIHDCIKIAFLRSFYALIYCFLVVFLPLTELKSWTRQEP